MRSELANELSALRDLKQILEESRQQIESERAALQSDTAKLQSELSARNLAGFGNADPLSTVLSLYYARLDLQRAFPEVRTGDYKELIQWASNATDDSAGRILADYIPWYRARITQLNDETTARLKVEETIKNLRQELTNQGASVQRLAEHVSQLDSEREKLQSELHARDDSITKMQSELLTRNDSIAKLQSEMFSFRGSFGFRLMRFYGPKVDRLCPEGTSRRKLKTLVSKSLRVIADEGLGSFFRKARRRIAKREFRVIEPSKLKLSTDVFYEAWIAENTLNARQLKDSIRSFLYKPKISIVMPVYNTEERFLTEAIESVRQQLYENWELCICDDGSTWPRVKKILSETCRQDKRIKVTNLSRNRGISVATNAALGLATGEFTGFLDHDDILYPDALFEVVRLLNHDPTIDYIYSDEDKIDQEGKRKDPFFKPDWSPDFILSGNYVTHFSVYRNSLLHTIGGLREGYEGSQDYDLVLRATEKTQKIRHISRVLYGWRESPRSTAGSEAVKPVAYVSAVKALQDAIVRRGTEADVEMLPIHRYRVRYAIKGKPLVTIIIPARIAKYIGKCVNSILQKTSYQNYEILVVDNSSTGFDISKTLQSSEKVRIIVDSSDYNFSRINNQAAGVARGEYLVFLNDDTEVLSEEWLSAMLEHAQREEIGAVGAKLLHANGTVQHAGIIVGINGLATNYSGMAASDPGYFALASMIRNCAAVTAACLMTRKQFFFKLGGFDESLGHSWNDVDFGIRVVQSGHRVVYTPFALLHHYVGGTRGAQDASPEEMRTRQMFREKDLEFIRRGDPFYNPNLSTELPYFPKCDLRIVSDPQALLRYVYETRQDLKDAYPEASNEDYAALYRWAASINEDTDSSWPILGRHQDWYLSQCK
jgi:glycosyltransferase involved in cell wall biosynthesis